MEGMTEFREISGIPGFKFGSDGSVWSLRTLVGVPGEWCECRQQTNRFGYKTVVVRVVIDGRMEWKKHLTHRLVLMAFAGEPPRGHHARHLNGIRDDNSIENLAWGTPKENDDDKTVHGTRRQADTAVGRKLSSADVMNIRRRYSDGGCSMASIGEEYGVSGGTIWSVVRRRKWKSVA